MKATPLLYCAAAVALSLTACQSPTRAEHEADDAQRRADQQIAEAKRDAEQRVAKAQADADEARHRAAVLLTQAATDLRRSVNDDLGSFAKDIARLREASGNARDKAKDSSAAALRDIDNRRATIEKQLRELESLSAEEFEKMKQLINAEMSELRKKISDAAGKLRT